MKKILVCFLFVVAASTNGFAEEPKTDPESGLVVAPGWGLVKSQCLVCHSAQTVIQNRATRKGWLDVIRWMQASQGLWHLGADEPAVLDYLAKNYGVPERYASMRRQPLSKEKMP